MRVIPQNQSNYKYPTFSRVLFYVVAFASAFCIQQNAFRHLFSGRITKSASQ
ncbi:Uncharacterised protein [Vibrio cholerae]|nr:Uncharacterised protein [Vibrio cholerae]